MIRPMFPISDDNERGHGPAFVSLAFIALNVVVFLVLQGAGASTEGAEFTYGYSAVPFEITNNVDLTEPEATPKEGIFSGQTVVITGTLPTLSRQEATALVEGAAAVLTDKGETALLVDPGLMLTQALMTAAFYPVMSWLMSAVRRTVGGI